MRGNKHRNTFFQTLTHLHLTYFYPLRYKFPFSLPPFYIAIIRCLGVLEGLAIQIDKDFRIVNDAYPYVASRLLTDQSSELQEALRQLLFQNNKPRWKRLRELLEKASSES